MPDDFDPTTWITIEEATQIAPYAPVTLRWLVREGRIKGLKRGGIWFLDKGSLLAYVEQMAALGRSKHDPTRAWAEADDDR